MQIYDSDNNLILDVAVDDTSYRYRAIMGDDNLTLKFSLAEHVEIPLGSWCEWQGDTYTLERPEALTMKHTRQFDYTVTMESPQAKAKMWKFRNTVDGRLKFSLTAKPVEHLQMFVDNMNAREDGWEIGECIDGDETLISYDHAYCYDAISQMAEEFETEFEIHGKTVSLHKVEYNKSDPLALSYGRGNGFQPSVARANYGDTPPVEILYVQGGSDNIDRSRYGNSELLLPKGQEIAYDGEHFEDETGFDSANSRTYVTDDQGYSVRRKGKDLTNMAEDSLDCSEIYPKRVGTVSEVIVADESQNFYDIVDESIPDDLDYSQCLIAGETMTVVFQSGMLSGKEFEASYDHATRKFELSPQEIDGIVMPGIDNGVEWLPVVGDKYAVFGCMVPDAYVSDNATKSGAEWDMFRKAVQYKFDNEDQKYTISGKLDGIWSKADWVNIGGKIVLGGYIKFNDARWQQDDILLRIIGVKDYINKPHSPELELSNGTVAPSYGAQMKQIESQEVLIDENYKKAVAYTKRRYSDAKETMTMIQGIVDTLSTKFTSSISPITIETVQILLGDESLQYRFVTELGGDTVAVHNVTYDSDAKQLTSEAGYLQHLTLGITVIADQRDASEYYCWKMSEFVSAVLDDADAAYYLYAKVRRYVRGEGTEDDQVGEFILSESAIAMEADDDYYYLLVGILNSESDGTRSFVTLYGYTEILPGRITTDKIVSNDGKTYFDLANNVIGGKIIFINTNGESRDLATEIDAKRRIFNDTPTPPYDRGDLWYGAEVVSGSDANGDYIRTSDITLDASAHSSLYLENYVDTNAESWKISAIDGSSWLHQSGTDQITIPANTDESSRTGTVTITATFSDGSTMDATITVTQLGASEVLEDSVSGSTLTQRKILICVYSKAEGESYERSDWADNIDYDNTQTVIDGGIVTSGTIQVAGDKSSILAGMTGKGTSDESVRFWAGDTFDNRESAPFRVLQNGTMVAAKAIIEGKITATSGVIGGFTIGSSSMTAEDANYGEMLLGEALLRFLHPSGSDYDSMLYLGGDTFPATEGGSAFGPIRIYVTREYTGTNVGGNMGITIQVTGAKRWDDSTLQNTGNHALYILNGDICGFRLRTRRVSASQTLSSMDSVILSTASSAITLTMPSDAEDGHIFFIRKVGAGNVTISGGTFMTNYNTTASQVTLQNGNLAILIYDELNGMWMSNYMSYMS